ncbi:Ig-like domain-containing protein [[Eubacterium] cellulosolvens]
MRFKILIVLGIICLLLSGLLPIAGSESYEVTRSRGTIILAVVNNNPPNEATNVTLDAVITVSFSMAINDTLFPDGFIISPFTVGDLTWTNGNETVTFTPTNDLYEDTTYQVTLGKNFIQSQDGDFTLEEDYIWSFTTIDYPDEFILIVGPFMTEEDKFVKDAKVTINIKAVEYTNFTNAAGIVTFKLPKQPLEGKYEILALFKGYKNIKYELEIDANGIYNPIPQLKFKKEEEPPSFIPGFEIIILLSGLAVILIMTRKIKK